jgi:asparagine synthase (glutamine-hydrolysing)
LKKILFHYDEPFADPAAIPTGIVSKYAAEKVKMVLTGDGADEVLAGYSTYQSENMAGAYQRLPRPIRQMLPGIAEASSYIFSGSLRYKVNQAARVLHHFNLPFQERLISKSLKIPVPEMKSIHSGNSLTIEDFMSDVFKQTELSDSFYLLNYYHLKVSLPAQMLVKVDRMSMAYSIETRAPFLDHRLVELLANVDKRVKMPDTRSVKNILKQAMKDVLPAEIVHRKKKGFDVPLREWFKDDAFDHKLNQDFDQFGLNGAQIRKLIAENKQGKADHGTLIWRLLVYAGWINQF